MVHLSLNLLVLTGLFFIVGMLSPKMALFFMEKPNRWTIAIYSGVMFMICATLFGEGKRQEALEQQKVELKKAPQIIADPEELPDAKKPSAEKQAPKKGFITQGD